MLREWEIWWNVCPRKSSARKIIGNLPAAKINENLVSEILSIIEKCIYFIYFAIREKYGRGIWSYRGKSHTLVNEFSELVFDILKLFVR